MAASNSDSENPNPITVPEVRSEAADLQSPFYLHHSDIPDLVLVLQALTGDNYGSWSRTMKIALSVKNKLGFIDGSISKLDGNDSQLLHSWTRNNNIVISWILNYVSKEIPTTIIHSESAADICTNLKYRFQQSNAPRIFQLRRDLTSLHQDNSSASVYFTRLKSLWEELSNFRPSCSCGSCTCGGVCDFLSYIQMEYTMAFLMGLNDSFAQIRGQILLNVPLPPINKVFSLVVQEERQRQITPHAFSTAAPSNTLAFVTKTDANSKGPRRKCPLCTHC
ncbi:uncharacterized protein LOC133302376 [Gastrolobium bilobum]|uniref:uncharacterized protein LOC133302376 n=1 Tax=Gastrolobium bilobum TaxID=150636 RepID=UPI002AB08430|nr:uncharacterized protein LOC133302376 [Gastrolobium bilobum]